MPIFRPRQEFYNYKIIMIKKIFFITLCCTVLYSTELRAQQLLTDLMDTTTQMGKGLFAMYQQYNALRFSVYVQPQFQVADTKGPSHTTAVIFCLTRTAG